MPDEDKLKEVLGQASEIIEKIKTLFDGFPYSTGNREDLEPCIGKQEAPNREECSIRNRRRVFSTAFDYSRAWGFITDSCRVDLTLYWAFDGCHLYDVFFTVSQSNNNGKWSFTPRVTIHKLQQKDKSKCVCCPRGGDVILIKIEIDAEYDTAFWPNPTMTETLFEGKLSAVTGQLTRL